MRETIWRRLKSRWVFPILCGALFLVTLLQSVGVNLGPTFRILWYATIGYVVLMGVVALVTRFLEGLEDADI